MFLRHFLIFMHKLYLDKLHILKQSSFKRIAFTLLICSLMQQDLPKSNQAIYSRGSLAGVSVRFLSTIYCYWAFVLMWQFHLHNNASQ